MLKTSRVIGHTTCARFALRPAEDLASIEGGHYPPVKGPEGGRVLTHPRGHSFFRRPKLVAKIS
jgi:hypothetical protein